MGAHLHVLELVLSHVVQLLQVRLSLALQQPLGFRVQVFQPVILACKTLLRFRRFHAGSLSSVMSVRPPSVMPAHAPRDKACKQGTP